MAHVFSQEDKLGSNVEVYELNDAISLTAMQSIARRSLCSAICFSYPTKIQGVFWVDTFNQQQQIQICGHGLLATANILKKRDKLVTKLCNRYTEADISEENQQLWLGFEIASIKAPTTPKLLDNCFIEPPCSSAIIGDENGYWVLEWPTEIDFLTLSPDFKRIIEQTSRAVIATQISSDANFDINLRYFAPQYGANEDAATGSACLILANYWQQRIGLSQCKVQQMSSEGAVIDCKIAHNKAWISGTVLISASKDLTSSQ